MQGSNARPTPGKGLFAVGADQSSCKKKAAYNRFQQAEKARAERAKPEDTTQKPRPPAPQGFHIVTTTFVNACVAPIGDPVRQDAVRQKMFRTGRSIGRAGREAVTAVGEGMSEAGAALRRLVTGDQRVGGRA